MYVCVVGCVCVCVCGGLVVLGANWYVLENCKGWLRYDYPVLKLKYKLFEGKNEDRYSEI